MKTAIVRIRGQAVASVLLSAVLSATTIPGLRAQTAPPAAAAEDSAVKLSDADLDELLGPIALYPDALIGIILPASTVPSDITLAARFLDQNGNDANVDDQPWDDSVKALARYPDVLKWMDQNLEWTNSLGEAFVEQPADVMNAVQRLRGEAKNTGNLVNTPQQTVVVEKEVIRIVPTDPEVIYVPQYDPQVVYVQPYQPDYTPLITFGAGFIAGAWLSYDFDWGRRDFYYGPGCGWNNRGRWWGDRGYRNGSVNVNNSVTNITNITNNNTTINRWRPSANSVRTFNQRQRKNLGNARIVRAQQNAQRNGNANAVNRNGKGANRPSAVPRPNRINVAKGNGSKPKAPAASQAGKTPGKGPNAQAGNRKKPDGSPARASNNAGKRPAKAPTAAPSVAGERPRKDRPSADKRPGDAPKKAPNASRNQAERPAKPKGKPSAAPNVGGNEAPSRTKKQNPSRNGGNSSVSRPKKSPEVSAPQRRPSASRPESAPSRKAAPERSQPRPKPAAERPRQQSARPQQSRPQARPQQAPKRQPAAKAGSSGGERRSEGKKKKKDD